jgi:3-hydroxyisobutyrate dehydrogenase
VTTDRRVSRPCVGFVGLGRMGWPMAHNLCVAGFELVVHDADPSVQERFASEHGCSAAIEPGGFAGASHVVTMLPDGSVVQEALLRWGGGIAAALAPGTLVIDMSSSAPTDTLALADAVADRNLRVVDAPVSGGLPRAVDGTLAIMVGGSEDAIASASDVLDVLGDPGRRFVCGGLGSGHAMKALNNFVGAANYAATAEALVIGSTFGLDPKTMLATINASTGRSFESEVVLEQHVVTGAYATGFALGLLAKDVSIAARLAESVGVEAPVVRLADSRLQAAVAALGGDVDHATVHRAWWERSLGSG